MTATDISTIINVNSAFGLLLGLLNGPILKQFSYRKVAMVSSLLVAVGYGLTSTAQSFTEFIIYYGIINSSGFGLNLASYSLALNTYFKKKRNLASGLCTAFTGLGPVFMPFVISFLMGQYGVRGAALILSALLLHSFAGSLILQPVKWHYRKPTVEDGIIEKELELLNPEGKSLKPKPKSVDENKDKEQENNDIDEIFDIGSSLLTLNENPVVPPTKITENGGGRRFSNVSLTDKTVTPDSTWWRKSSNSGSQLRISPSKNSLRCTCDKNIRKEKPKRWTSKLYDLFDLDLLKDSGYRNIWLGMSLAFTGEINFSLMTPMILGDRDLNIVETAQIMSVIASADIIFRFISPFLGDAINRPPKDLYMASLVLLVITRGSLTFAYGFWQILGISVLIGIAKGFRTVYMTLVIPSYVPLEKLASASGLQTVLNGLFLIVAGPLLGYVRDKTGSYNMCIHIINTFSIITICLWSVDMVLQSRKAKKVNSEGNGFGT